MLKQMSKVPPSLGWFPVSLSSFYDIVRGAFFLGLPFHWDIPKKQMHV